MNKKRTDMRQTNIWLSEHQHRMLELFARRHNLGKSAVVRLMLDIFLDEFDRRLLRYDISDDDDTPNPIREAIARSIQKQQ